MNNTTAKNNWYVITGAPSSGKTTLIELLEKRGFHVIHEAARAYINEEIERGRTINEIRRDELQFQKKILELKIEQEKALDPEKIFFLDRGIPDSIAYYALYGAREDEFLKNATRYCSYRKVFLLDMVENEQDYARIENEEQRQQIHDLLFKCYSELRIPLFAIPAMPPEERIDYILTKL